MSSEKRWAMIALVTLIAGGCSKEESKTTSSADSVDAAPPAAMPSASAVVAAPSASASGPPVDCPKGSSGEGSFAKPCDAKGAARMMEVTWTKKMDDKGPSFRVTNKSPLVILYGKIAVYFYDKAGKQLDVKDASASPPTTRPYHTCTGNMFGGVMKAGEKAVITFSCVRKANVPEGTAAIEAEMQTVGFADPSEKQVAYYWRNNDLAPDVRKKGGNKS